MTLLLLFISLSSLVYTLIVGAIGGWLAGHILRGHGFGLATNIVLGIIGGIIGGWLFGILGIQLGSNWLGDIIGASAGAIVLVLVAGFLKK